MWAWVHVCASTRMWEHVHTWTLPSAGAMHSVYCALSNTSMCSYKHVYHKNVIKLWLMTLVLGTHTTKHAHAGKDHAWVRVMCLWVIDTLLSCDFSRTHELLARYSCIFIKLLVSGNFSPCVIPVAQVLWKKTSWSDNCVTAIIVVYQ